MPHKTILEIPADEQALMLKELRQVRYGYFLSLHILLLLASGKTPSQIAAVLFCSRSSVYRAKAAYLNKEFCFHWQKQEEQSHRVPKRGSWQHSLLSLIRQSPKVFGWCRTRWSCATLCLELKAQRGITLSRESVRRTLHQLGYAYKRARHVALDNDPERVLKLARIRSIAENLPTNAALFFADELDIHLLPKLGYEWMKKGTQTKVMTPGQNQKAYLAGAWNYLTGKVLAVTAENKDRHLFINLLEAINRSCAATKFEKLYVVVDNYRIHKAKDVIRWIENHPRIELVFLPSYCPAANPIERIFGDCHDHCTRNHKRKKLCDLVSDVIWYMKSRGSWRYRLSNIYYEEAVTKALDQQQSEVKLMVA